LASCQNWSVPEDLYSYPMPPANNYYYNNSPMGYYPNQQPQMNQPSRNMQYYDYDNSYMAPNNSYMAPNNRYQQPVRRAPQVRNIAPRTNYRYDRNRQNIYRSYQPNYYNRPSDNDSLYYYNYTPRNNSVIDQYDVGR
jgi:hypothetical protein